MTNMVMTGNPGVGKSTIANTLIGHVEFQSGVYVERGANSVLQTYTAGDITYADTPGLDDVETRKRAALEISRAVNEGASLKLVFVVTLENGRIRPADVATVDVVLAALEDVDATVDHHFSLIVNCCDAVQMRLLDDPTVAELVRDEFGAGRALSHALFLPNDTNLSGLSNRMLDERQRGRLADFMDAAPSLSVAPSVQVCDENYDAAMERAAKVLTRLRDELDGLERNRFFSTVLWIAGILSVFAGSFLSSAFRAFL